MRTRSEPTSRHSKGLIQGVRVRVMPGNDHKRAEPCGTIVGVREVEGRHGYQVRHDCGRLRTWQSTQLGKDARR